MYTGRISNRWGVQGMLDGVGQAETRKRTRELGMQSALILTYHVMLVTPSCSSELGIGKGVYHIKMIFQTLNSNFRANYSLYLQYALHDMSIKS